MIAISSNLIRSARSSSFDENDRPDVLLNMLKNSPPDHKMHFSDEKEPDSDEELMMAVAKPQPETKRGSVSEKPKATTRVVKFDVLDKDKKAVPAVAVPSGQPFQKEMVPAKAAQSQGVGSLFKELQACNMLHSDDCDTFTSLPSPGGPSLKLKVYIAIGEDPIVVIVKGGTMTNDIIERVIAQAEMEEREPELIDDPHAYELRMLDDDDGTPDMDMAALDRRKDIRQFNLSALALCLRTDQNSVTLSLNETRAAARKKRANRTPSMQLNKNHSDGGKVGKFYVKVHTDDNEKYVLQAEWSMTLEELLPSINKKKRVTDISGKHYKFLYMDGKDLEMKTTFFEAGADEYKLVMKVPQANISSTLSHAAPSNVTNTITFTKETAFTYSEYSVIKTNARGRKQSRIMGIDKSTIYNKHSSTRKISLDKQKVYRNTRAIGTVEKIEAAKYVEKAFVITFKPDGPGKKAESREYQTETKMECQEIISKVHFLMLHQG